METHKCELTRIERVSPASQNTYPQKNVDRYNPHSYLPTLKLPYMEHNIFFTY